MAATSWMRASAGNHMDKIIRNLDRVFDPKTVAIVGASATPNKIGNVVVKNFLDARFQGRVCPVNPKYPDILGYKCFPDVGSIPGTVDLVIIAIPAEGVPDIMDECVKK